jgi:hypothetical protein
LSDNLVMRRAKTPVADVATVLSAQIRRELQTAAGNALLSRTEQAKALPYVQEAASEIRAENGPGARVSVDALESKLVGKALRLIDSVNHKGPAYLSKKEATSAFRSGGRLGEVVLRAYEVASGNGVNVDEIARARIAQNSSQDSVVKVFASEQEAYGYVEPNGNPVAWVVPETSDLLKKTFLLGRNDLWVERIEIDRLSGAITVLDEH